MKLHKIQSAFTLIELLVVIAIIAILAAILFPVFGRARENARKSSCASNLKQLGLAAQMYSQDFDEILPRIYVNDPSSKSWAQIIQPYVKSTQAFNCPSYSDINYDGTFYSEKLAYGMNARFDPFYSSSQNIGIPLARVSKPSETVLFTDGVNFRTTFTGGAMDTPPPDRKVAYRHLEMTNVAFVDGHVKSMRKDNLEVKATTEDGAALSGDNQFILWNFS